jgi:hypothetical protein
MEETQFLGPFLVENPSMFVIFEKIRDKHDIDTPDPPKDLCSQRILQDMITYVKNR